MKICHLVPFTFMCKIHFTFEGFDDVKNYYILPKENIHFKFLQRQCDMIQSKNKLFYSGDFLKNNKSLILVINYLNSIKPDVIILASPPHLSLTLLKTIKSLKAKLAYIGNGISNVDAVNLSVKLKRALITQWSNYDYLFVNKHEKKMWEVNKKYITNGNIHIIDGLPQLDYMRKLDFKALKKIIYEHVSPSGSLTNNISGISLEKKSILYIQNKKLHSNNIKYYKETLALLDAYSKKNNCHVFVKIKHIPGIRTENIVKSKNFTYIGKNTNLSTYPFLGCDIIFAEHYGTGHLEGLYMNPKTLVYQHTRDLLNIKKYNLLPQAYNKKEVVKWFDIFLFSNKYPSKESEIQKDNFLKDHIGEKYKTANTTEEIINIIKQK